MKTNSKKFKVSDWRKMQDHAMPTGMSPMIKRDDDGNLWAWESSGKHVWAKPVAK